MKKFDSWKKGLAGAALAVGIFCMAAISCFAADGKVIAETAKIRAQASTDSEVVGSTVKGKVIDILGAVKDSGGTTWYKVAVANGGYGYIRGDLVETSANIPISENNSQPASSSGGSGSQPADTVPTAIGEQQATVKDGNNARVRSGASTKHDTVASLPSGTTITLVGEANDSSGNKWYQIKCNYNGKDVEGYVRSDLVVLGAAGEGQPAEGENAGGEGENPEGGENPGGEGENPEGGEGEASAPEQPEEHNDYEIVYAQNEAGEFEYYLYDNVNSNRQKLGDLLNVVNVANENSQKLQDQIDKGKIIIIILAVVIVILFIVLTVLLFKIRELYYEDYEDEEEEEEEEEPAPVKKKSKKRAAEEEEEEEPAPVKRKKTPASQTPERPARNQEKTGQSKARGEKELHAAEKKEPVKKPARKPQNFLVEDDEFEFEFLNMDDKDL